MQELKSAIKSRSLTAVAKDLAVSPQCLCNWIRRGGVPAEYAVRVESALGVPRQRLRPKDWHLIWPELIGAEGAPAASAEPEQAPA